MPDARRDAGERFTFGAQTDLADKRVQLAFLTREGYEERLTALAGR